MNTPFDYNMPTQVVLVTSVKNDMWIMQIKMKPVANLMNFLLKDLNEINCPSWQILVSTQSREIMCMTSLLHQAGLKNIIIYIHEKTGNGTKELQLKGAIY